MPIISGDQAIEELEILARSYGIEMPVDPDDPLRPVRFITGEKLPEREWIAGTAHDGWIPTRKATLLQGDGGDGKTPLLQQLQSSCATGLPWLGLRVMECVSLGFYTEDEERDLKERQAAIDIGYGCSCASTGMMHVYERADRDNALVTFDGKGAATPTAFYHQIIRTAKDLRARLITLDVAVDLFGGDENERQQVRAFMRLLNRLARLIDGAVVLSAHVSQAGIRSGGGHSGSTDWSNAARSRLYLGRPGKNGNGNGDSEPIDTNERLLTRKKANFASAGETIKLRWQNGIIVPAFAATPSYFRRTAEDVFLALLDAMRAEGQHVSSNSRGSNYAPALFMKRPKKERDDFQRGDFERALQSLFQARKVKIVPFGRPSKGQTVLARIDAPASDEEGEERLI